MRAWKLKISRQNFNFNVPAMRSWLQLFLWLDVLNHNIGGNFGQIWRPEQWNVEILWCTVGKKPLKWQFFQQWGYRPPLTTSIYTAALTDIAYFLWKSCSQGSFETDGHWQFVAQEEPVCLNFSATHFFDNFMRIVHLIYYYKPDNDARAHSVTKQYIKIGWPLPLDLWLSYLMSHLLRRKTKPKCVDDKINGQ